MQATPSTNGSNGRNGQGKFAEGNRGGPGNPHARRVAELRSALLDKIGDRDLQEVVDMLLAKAKAGDITAAKEVLDRALGKAHQSIELDASIGIPEPEKELTRWEILRRAFDTYIALCVPKRAWVPGYRVQYEAWQEGNGNGHRPDDWDQITARVEAHCNWIRMTPEADRCKTRSNRHMLFDGQTVKQDESRLEVPWGKA